MTDTGVHQRNSSREPPGARSVENRDEPRRRPSHSRWECKSHVLFIPECSRKTLYEKLRPHLGEVLKKLAVQGMHDGRRAPDAESRAHADIDTAKVRGIAGSGIHQWQERVRHYSSHAANSSISARIRAVLLFHQGLIPFPQFMDLG